MNNDFIFWTFSAASQSISAFVAFLLTGYALVHTIMEAARERDDSLEEVHNQLKVSQHRWLTGLAALTGTAIVLSLVVVYLNRSNAPVAGWMQALVALIDLVAVVGGLWFVVSIVDPRKYQKAAEKELRREREPSHHRSRYGHVSYSRNYFRPQGRGRPRKGHP